MTKALTLLLLGSVSAMYVTGCAVAASPVLGVLHTDVWAPVTATDNEDSPTRVGTASASSVLGIIAVGDASINAAMMEGGISNIHHVDYRAQSFFGVYSKFTVYVYGTGPSHATASEPDEASRNRHLQDERATTPLVQQSESQKDPRSP